MDQPQAIVGLSRRPDGMLVLLTSSKDGGGKAILCPDRDALWAAIGDVLGRADAPQLASAPSEGKKKASSASSSGSSSSGGYITEEKLGDAYKTIFSEIERKAKETWSAPVVDAAATVLADASKRMQGSLAKVSKRGPSKLFELRKGRRKTGS